jgi:hypothetical protein
MFNYSKRIFCSTIKKEKYASRENKFIIMNLFDNKKDTISTSTVFSDIITRYHKLKSKHVIELSDCLQQPIHINPLASLTALKLRDINPYYDSVLNSIDKIQTWPIPLKQAIKNHISNHITNTVAFDLIFEAEGKKETLHVNMNKPELIPGITFLILHPNSPQALKLQPYTKENSLVDSKIYAINPLNNEKLYIIISDEIEADTEAGVPSHVPSHFNMAKKYNIPIKYVLKPLNELKSTLIDEPNRNTSNIPQIGSKPGLLTPDVDKIKLDNIFSPVIIDNDEGFLVNSREFDYLFIQEAKELIMKNLELKGKSKRVISVDIDTNLYNFIEQFNDFSFKIDKNFELNEEFFKSYFPIDICITPISNYKVILYYTIIYQFILKEILGIDVEKRIKEIDFDEVITSRAHELEREFYMPFPFKEIILINKEVELPDVSGCFEELLTLLKIIPESELNAFKEDGDKLSTLVNHIGSKFDIESIIEEYKVCNKNNPKIVSKLMILFGDVYKYMDKRDIDAVVRTLMSIQESLLNNFEILKAYPNALVNIYRQYLIMLYLISPTNAKEYYDLLVGCYSLARINIEDNDIEKIKFHCETISTILED